MVGAKPMTAVKKIAGLWLMFGAFLCAPPSIAADNPKDGITVFAAASLTDVLQELGDGFTKDSSVPVRFSFAASSTLARQIENGAPADMFFSADLEWMDYLQARKLIEPATRHDVLGNRLVLIAPTDSQVMLKIQPHFALAATLGKDRLATGDPDSVPVGRYAREALTNLGVWDEVSARLVRADSVRSALVFVDRGEAAFGIVYLTDALVDKKVRVVDEFPANTHKAIIYPVALTPMAKEDAAKFLSFIRGPAGNVAFQRYGFTVLH
jgi:molybdate transport system substrate-binding protein